jgi:hypothetical protein
VFEGREGVGRTAVAEIYAQCLAEDDLIASGSVRKARLADFPVLEPKQAQIFAAHLFEQSAGGCCCCGWTRTSSGARPSSVRPCSGALRPAVTKNQSTVLVLAGEANRVAQILRERADVAGCFADSLSFPNYDAQRPGDADGPVPGRARVPGSGRDVARDRRAHRGCQAAQRCPGRAPLRPGPRGGRTDHRDRVPPTSAGPPRRPPPRSVDAQPQPAASVPG